MFLNDEFLEDDAFNAYAAKADEAARRREGAGNNFTFEDVKWTGTETGIPKIVRVVGGAPDTNVNNYTARTLVKARIKDDNGKWMEVWRPVNDPSYILNRIIARICKVQYVNQQKVYPVKEKYPELFNLIEKNGFKEEDQQYRFDRGWKGTEVMIMNVIDRSMMDWHRENKHTALLAKSINVGPDGTEYPDKGISSFAVSSRLAHIFGAYGSWGRYDLAIIRTGRKDNPYTIINASHSPAEVDKAYRDLISTEEGLTDEEKTWEAYDLTKVCAITSATKIYNRLQHTIKRIDAALGTEFLEEIKEQADREQKERAERMEAEGTYTSTAAKEEEFKTEVEETAPWEDVAPSDSVPVQEKVEEKKVEEKPAPVRGRKVENKFPEMPYFDSLSPELQSKVLEAKKEADGTVNVKWDVPMEELVACPECHAISPLDATKCPVCGIDFI